MVLCGSQSNTKEGFPFYGIYKQIWMMSEVDVGRVCDLNDMCSQYTASIRVKTYDIPYICTTKTSISKLTDDK